MAKRINYNTTYFKNIDTSNKAYFLGFIYADGSLNTKNRKQLTIKIHPKDIDVLEKFKNDINFEGNIYHDKKRDTCQISLSGKELISDLESHGLHSNKTYSIEYPSIPVEYEIDFIRGFFDGDGCIRIKHDKKTNKDYGTIIFVCASIPFLEKLNQRISFLCGTKMNKLYGPKNYKFISWASLSDVEKIYERFYETNSIYMDRKKEIFNEVYILNKSKTKYRKN